MRHADATQCFFCSLLLNQAYLQFHFPGAQYQTAPPHLLILRRRFQPPSTLSRPVRMELFQVEQRGIRLERIFTLVFKVGVHLVSVGTREELDGGTFSVCVGVGISGGVCVDIFLIPV